MAIIVKINFKQQNKFQVWSLVVKFSGSINFYYRKRLIFLFVFVFFSRRILFAIRYSWQLTQFRKKSWKINMAKSNISFQTKNTLNLFVISPSHVLMNNRLFLWRIHDKNLWRTIFCEPSRFLQGLLFRSWKRKRETLAPPNFHGIKNSCLKWRTTIVARLRLAWNIVRQLWTIETKIKQVGRV